MVTGAGTSTSAARGPGGAAAVLGLVAHVAWRGELQQSNSRYEDLDLKELVALGSEWCPSWSSRYYDMMAK